MELKKLSTKFLGRNIEIFEQIDSTQLEILRRIENKTKRNVKFINKKNSKIH